MVLKYLFISLLQIRFRSALTSIHSQSESEGDRQQKESRHQLNPYTRPMHWWWINNSLLGGPFLKGRRGRRGEAKKMPLTPCPCHELQSVSLGEAEGVQCRSFCILAAAVPCLNLQRCLKYWIGGIGEIPCLIIKCSSKWRTKETDEAIRAIYCHCPISSSNGEPSFLIHLLSLLATLYFRHISLLSSLLSESGRSSSQPLQASLFPQGLLHPSFHSAIVAVFTI